MDEPWEKNYKYNCRGCPVRERCIRQNPAPSEMLDTTRNAFASRTDTRQMWNILQKDCLIIKEEIEQREQEESLLSQRLRKTRASKELPPAQEPAPLKTAPLQSPRPVTHTRPLSALPEDKPTPPRPQQARATGYYLFSQPGRRRIALPGEGDLVLGRFDSSVGLSPDVDLRYDDPGKTTVSRRHAKISGFRGRHTIEDLGSTNGTKVNDRPLKPGETTYLEPGDLISFGSSQFSYEPAPEWVDNPSQPTTQSSRYYLLVLGTGRRFDLSDCTEDIVIGRAESLVGPRVTVDLLEEGEVSTCVSKKHARLFWQDGGYFLEDLGSAFGTKVNGAIVWLNNRFRLKPGDHIWLGGCVLAYDVIREGEEAPTSPKESLLSKRLRKTGTGIEPKTTSLLEPLPPDLSPSPPPAEEAPPIPKPRRSAPAQKETPNYYLIVQPEGRKIALPGNGPLMLGRFDPSVGLSPDVDLGYEEPGKTTVSRRHAKVTGFGGRHTIVDLGSTNGTKVNGQQLNPGEVVYLKPGDTIELGNRQLTYETAAQAVARIANRYFLLVTGTGRRFDLPRESGEIIIGRADLLVGSRPDIDLREENEVNLCVSRRHARLVWREGNHFLEDLGSAFGTRINGSIVWLGDLIRLKPGDHIWLGGCVLAYDAEP